MNKFDQVLDDCLEQLTNDGSTVDECLTRHPEHAAQLGPFLQTAVRFELAHEVQPSHTFKDRTRAQLYAHMQSHPRSKKDIVPFFWRVTVSFLILALAFVSTGTAYAQSVLPGDPFYDWKLTSEHVWRAVSGDPVSADLAVADRRIDEWAAVSNDPERSARALDGYLEVLIRLESETDAGNAGYVIPVLESHQKTLKDAGLSVPELDDVLSSDVETGPTEVPAETAPKPGEKIDRPFSTEPPLPNPKPTHEGKSP